MHPGPTPKPKPIRYDADTWLVMRNDPVIPKAVIQRVHGRDNSGDRFMVFAWDPLDTTKRRLMGVKESLEDANEFVKYDNTPTPDTRNPAPNGGAPIDMRPRTQG